MIFHSENIQKELDIEKETITKRNEPLMGCHHKISGTNKEGRPNSLVVLTYEASKWDNTYSIAPKYGGKIILYVCCIWCLQTVEVLNCD